MKDKLAFFWACIFLVGVIAAAFFFVPQADGIVKIDGVEYAVCVMDHDCWEQGLHAGKNILLRYESAHGQNGGALNMFSEIEYLLSGNEIDGYTVQTHAYREYTEFDEGFRAFYKRGGVTDGEIDELNQEVSFKQPELQVACHGETLYDLRRDLGYGSSDWGTSDGFNFRIGNERREESLTCSRNNFQDLIGWPGTGLDWVQHAEGALKESLFFPYRGGTVQVKKTTSDENAAVVEISTSKNEFVALVVVSWNGLPAYTTSLLVEHHTPVTVAVPRPTCGSSRGVDQRDCKASPDDKYMVEVFDCAEVHNAGYECPWINPDRTTFYRLNRQVDGFGELHYTSTEYQDLLDDPYQDEYPSEIDPIVSKNISF